MYHYPTDKRPTDERLSPSRRQLQCLEALIICGTQKDAATYLGISIQTFKNHMGTLYKRMGTNSSMETASKLGWVNIPSNEAGPSICGWVGYCSRSFNHKGRHSDFRALDTNNGELFNGVG